jgi:DNA-binding transcriptional ArsR family regulator
MSSITHTATLDLPIVEVESDQHQEPEQTDQASKKELFPGFQEGKGYTEFNHAIFDEMLSQIDNLAELKIVMYVHRHTIGWSQTEVHISVQEFMTGRKSRSGEPLDRGTGLSERSVQNGIKKAVEDGYITRRQEGTRVYFSLKMAQDNQQAPASDQDTQAVSSNQPSQPQQVQSLHPSTDHQQAQNLHPRSAGNAPRTGKTCTPGVQSLHPRTRVNPHQNRPDAPPKENTERNSKDREKEKGVSLSQNSFSSHASGGGYQKPGSTHNPRQDQPPENVKDASSVSFEEQRRLNLEKYAAILAKRKNEVA